MFWFAKFMSERFGVNIKTIGLPMITVYLLADVGSIAGGWQSSWLLKRGWTANAAMFSVAASAYLLALLMIQLLVPRLEPVDPSPNERRWQFSLRTLLVVMTVAALVLGLVAYLLQNLF